MKRVLVIGCPGSGKCTFARRLQKIINLPLCYLDMLFWNKDKTTVSKEEFDKRLDDVLCRDEWIIDGNFERILEERMKFCDTVFYFDFSTVQCLFGVTERVLKNYGKTREDMGGNCPERFDLEFYKAILRFNKKNRPKTKALLEKYKPDVIVFKNRKQAKDFLNSL